MKIVLEINITEAYDKNGKRTEATQDHYRRFVDAYRDEHADAEHELFPPGDYLLYEITEVSQVCDICNTHPCRCK